MCQDRKTLMGITSIHVNVIAPEAPSAWEAPQSCCIQRRQSLRAWLLLNKAVLEAQPRSSQPRLNQNL